MPRNGMQHSCSEYTKAKISAYFRFSFDTRNKVHGRTLYVHSMQARNTVTAMFIGQVSRGGAVVRDRYSAGGEFPDNRTGSR